MYNGRNTNNFDQFISSFYYGDLLPEEDRETLKQTFYNEKFEFSIEPLEYTRGNYIAEFTYIEITKIRGNNNRFILNSQKVTAVLVKSNTTWKIFELNYLEAYPFSIPQDILTTYYEAHHNKDFDSFIDCFYYADLLDESSIQSLKDYLLMDSSFTFKYEIEPIDLSVNDSNSVQFTYYEINTVTTSAAKLVKKTKVTAHLRKKDSVWKIEAFDYGTSEIVELVRY
ncbi:MAG: hypothetical protein GX383_02670 [Clostridium sp.]|nr:hypothetical protein [Clostridium sp.]